MYAIDWNALFTRPAKSQTTAGATRHRAIGRTVWALGATSLFTDISSEMVASILPVYLVLHLGISPLAFGVVDGIYQGGAALVRVAAGLIADRCHRYKEVATTGYVLSAASRLLILAAGATWSTIAGVVALDRLGKSIRTAPRDALIAQRTPKESLATAFGVHRSMDAAGAMFGPILAFALLAIAPGGYDLLFVASFGIALIGVAAIVLFVPVTVANERQVGGAAITPRSAGTLLADGRFRSLVVSGSLLGLTTISDSFIFLILQRQLGLGATAFPLLYVGTSVFTSVFAVACGGLADRAGRQPVLLTGYAILAAVYAVLVAFPEGGITLAVATIVMLGAYYAATEGVLTAMAAAVLPASHSGTGLAVLATATNVSRLVASIGFGWLWTTMGVSPATRISFVALVAAIVATAAALRHANQDVRSASTR